MPTPLTIQALYDDFHIKLGLEWIAGQQGGKTLVRQEETTDTETMPVGYLSLVRPNNIQILGRAELDYLTNLQKDSYQGTLEQLFQFKPAAIIIADNMVAPESIQHRADTLGIPLFKSTLAARSLLEHLQDELVRLLSDKVVIHGVFLEVLGIGVLLTGPSAVGKSELALELLSRGHRLIADDAPEFSYVVPGTIYGACPEVLQDFLEVRGLGILNVRAMFGENAVLNTKRLRLIINLRQLTEAEIRNVDRLDSGHKHREISGVEIPEVLLPVAPGRNLSVIVETAVRNHILYLNGYDAAGDFMARQQQHIKANKT